ncbi:MAG: hypothetical protein HYX65_07930 [Gemmatimonadetes bacterium]|nr:hypothetical protein [Gemmatimonadota bacterium]
MKLRSFVGMALIAAVTVPASASAQWLGLTQSSAWEFSLAFGEVGRALSGTKVMGTRTFAAMDKRFSVGWGLRGSIMGGDNLPHMGRGDPRDTLFVSNPGVLALNAVVMGTARLTGNIELGANVDLLGISLGGDKRANLLAQGGALTGAQTATVTNLNVFGFGTDNQRGSLLSEVFLQYGVNPEWKVRFGYSKFWTDYQIDLVVDGSRRFRSSVTAAFIGARYTPQ